MFSDKTLTDAIKDLENNREHIEKFFQVSGPKGMTGTSLNNLGKPPASSTTSTITFQQQQSTTVGGIQSFNFLSGSGTPVSPETSHGTGTQKKRSRSVNSQSRAAQEELEFHQRRKNQRMEADQARRRLEPSQQQFSSYSSVPSSSSYHPTFNSQYSSTSGNGGSVIGYIQRKSSSGIGQTPHQSYGSGLGFGQRFNYSSQSTSNRVGMKGLRNLGNTCFFNSTLQCFFQTKQLISFMNQVFDEEPHSVLYEFKLLVNSVWGSSSVIPDPFPLLQALWKKYPPLKRFQPQDSHELFLRLTNELGAKDFFEVGGKYCTICSSCQRQSDEENPWAGLCLPIPRNLNEVNLWDCFHLWEKDDNISEYQCEACANRLGIALQLACFPARRSHIVEYLPPILVINLIRWNQGLKYLQNVQFYESFEFYGIMYKLYGVVCHEGDIYGGHYFSFVKSFDSRDFQSRTCWWKISDEVTQPVNLQTVLSSQAYVLYYERAIGF